MTKDALILFTRYPQPGDVKTRLAAKLGDDVACELYACFLRDLAAMTRQIPAEKIIVYAGPDQAVFEDFPGVRTLRQRGSVVGERMFFALQDVSALGFDRMVLIGGDLPDLPASRVTEALKRLNESDVVIGPGTDGGYYLIGCKAGGLNRSVFDDMDWSTATVFPETLRRLSRAGLTVGLVDPWSDIDVVEDLLSFVERNRHCERFFTLTFINKRRIIHGL